MSRQVKKQKTNCDTELLNNLVQKVRENRCLEFELRIGKMIDGSFSSGVTSTLFEELYKDLTKCEEISKNETWKETMDVFFNHKGEEYRTRVSYPNNNMKIVSETIIKRKLDTANIKTSGKYNLRLNISEEEEVKDGDIPILVEPTYVRLKQTISFFIMDNQTKKWSIDLSKSWGAKTRTQVEEKQHNETPKYEIECELVDTKVYVDTNTNEHITSSLIMKGLDLLGIPNSVYEIESVKLYE
jgi:hypothetical protein